VNSIDQFSGTYAGAGTWHDAVGQSSAYRIIQTNLATDEGFEVTFKHDFDDGSVVEARFRMTWIAPFVFRVDVAGAPVGNGYVFDGYCHYHLKVGEAFVEASYRTSSDGLEVFGSSTRNADGNYIAWRESLRRQAA
jgi:hypothetical protein